MWADTGVSLSVSLASVFGVTLLLTFDLTSSFIILVTISMIIADMLGLMYWWNISLNAVSLVNLVMVCVHGLGWLHLAQHFFSSDTSTQPPRHLSLIL